MLNFKYRNALQIAEICRLPVLVAIALCAMFLQPTAALSAAVSAAAEAGKPPTIAVSIKPLHSLVSAVTRGVTEPVLLLDGYSSPHTTPLKPSTRRRVQDADVLVWVGSGVEVFLARVVADLTASRQDAQTRVVTFSEVDGIERLPFRIDNHDHAPVANHGPAASAGTAGDGHDDHESVAVESYDNVDFHYWLDPHNAMRLTEHLVTVLAERDPANAERYAANAAILLQRLREVDRHLEELLGGLSAVAYLVFHDSFQYFEQRYGLHRALVIAEQPEVSPGARRLKKILQRVRDENVKCLFTEPQFPARVVSMLQRDSAVDLATLDPLASSFSAGPELYPQWILELGETIHGCLTGEAK